MSGADEAGQVFITVKLPKRADGEPLSREEACAFAGEKIAQALGALR